MDVDTRRARKHDHAATATTTTTAIGVGSGLLATTTVTAVRCDSSGGLDRDPAERVDDQDTATGTATTALTVDIEEAGWVRAAAWALVATATATRAANGAQQLSLHPHRSEVVDAGAPEVVLGAAVDPRQVASVTTVGGAVRRTTLTTEVGTTDT